MSPPPQGSGGGVVSGSQGVPFDQDPVTKSLVDIGHPHNQIHAGDKFVSSDVVTGIGAGATKRYLLITPNTATRIHLLTVVSSAPGSVVTIFETPTITSNGSPLAKINQERNSPKLTTLSVFADPTITVNGTQLVTEEIGSGTAAGKFSGSTSGDRNELEFVLKQNTAYLITITALSPSTDVSTKFHWYEE